MEQKYRKSVGSSSVEPDKSLSIRIDHFKNKPSLNNFVKKEKRTNSPRIIVIQTEDESLIKNNDSKYSKTKAQKELLDNLHIEEEFDFESKKQKADHIRPSVPSKLPLMSD